MITTYPLLARDRDWLAARDWPLGLAKSDAAESVMESAKLARLRDLLAELVAEGRRVLVFSQFVEMPG